MVDIKTNLLKNRQTLSEKDYQREKKLLQWSVFAVVIVVVAVMAISIWNLILTRQMSLIEQAITTSSKQMQGLSQASIQQIYLKSRLNLVTNFLADRSLTRESLQKIFSFSIPGTHVAGLAFEKNSILDVQYISNSTQALNQLLGYYQADNGYFTQIVSSGITRGKDGNYQISLALTLPNGGK